MVLLSRHPVPEAFQWPGCHVLHKKECSLLIDSRSVVAAHYFWLRNCYAPLLAVALGLAGCQHNPPATTPVVVEKESTPPPAPTTTEEHKTTVTEETKPADPNNPDSSTTTKRTEETVKKKQQ